MCYTLYMLYTAIYIYLHMIIIHIYIHTYVIIPGHVWVMILNLRQTLGFDWWISSLFGCHWDHQTSWGWYQKRSLGVIKLFDELMLWPLGLDFWDWPAFPESVEKVDHLLINALRIFDWLQQWVNGFSHFGISRLWQFLSPLGAHVRSLHQYFFCFYILNAYTYIHTSRYVYLCLYIYNIYTSLV